MTTIHSPVMVQEVLAALAIQPDDIVLDGTMGFGGHSQEMRACLGLSGRLIGIDRDPVAVAHCRQVFSQDHQVSIYHQSFSTFDAVTEGITKALFDLGMSSFHLDGSGRGFSFLKDEPLDMRMNPESGGETAYDLLQARSQSELQAIFTDYGDLYRPEKLVSFIQHEGVLLKSTFGLVRLIKKSFFFRNQRTLFLKTCSQVFQALRIAVNCEFDEIALAIHGLEKCLLPGGRVAFLTFHSGEDRLVKVLMKGNPSFKRLGPNATKAGQSEIRQNSRAKSARLRVYERQFSAYG